MFQHFPLTNRFCDRIKRKYNFLVTQGLVLKPKNCPELFWNLTVFISLMVSQHPNDEHCKSGHHVLHSYQNFDKSNFYL